MKKLCFALILALSLVLCLTALAQSSGTCGDHLTWTLDDAGTLTISGTGNTYDYTQPIFFSYRNDIKKLVIRQGVTGIGSSIFYGCRNLTTVVIPKSVAYARKYAFYECSGLTDIYYTGSRADWNRKIENYDFGDTGNEYFLAATVHCGSTFLTLNQSSAALVAGQTLTLTANKAVTWSSNSKQVATVSTGGKVTALKAGTAEITATDKVTGDTAVCTVTVEHVLTLSQSSAALAAGQTLTLKASKAVTWTSSSKKLATVDADGQVIALKAGKVKITATCKATGETVTCTVTVKKGAFDIKAGTKKNFAALKVGKTLTLKPIITGTVKFKSSDKKVATVDKNGVITAKKAGIATITLTCAGKKAYFTVRVK